MIFSDFWTTPKIHTMKKLTYFTLSLLACNGLAQTVFNVADINPGIAGSECYDVIELNGELIFNGSNGTDGYELHVYNPITGLTSYDIETGGGSSNPSQFVNYDNRIFFTANRSDVGYELFYYDGSDVFLVEDYNPGMASFNPNWMTVFNYELYFQGELGDTGVELFKYDGTNISLVEDMELGTASSGPDRLTATNNYLYFSADAQGKGRELWRTDGSSTVCLDLNPGIEGSWPDGFYAYEDNIYFNATMDYAGSSLGYEFGHHTDTSYVFIDIEATGNSFPTEFIRYGEDLIFIAETAAKGREMYRYDALTYSAERLTDFIAGSGDSFTIAGLMGEKVFHEFEGKLYFGMYYPTKGKELYRFDGLDFELVSDINPGPSNSLPTNFITVNDRFYFTAKNNDYGIELWVSDGNVVQLIADIYSAPETTGSNPYNLTLLNDDLYFFAENETVGKELFKIENAHLNDEVVNQSSNQELNAFLQNGNLIVQIPSEIISSQLNVYAITGSLVYSAWVSGNQVEVQLPQLNGGTYILSLIDEEKGETYTKKIIL